MKKVYCEECKHCIVEGISHISDLCRANMDVELVAPYYNNREYYITKKFCREKNYNNLCKDFEQKESIWNKILQMVK